MIQLTPDYKDPEDLREGDVLRYPHGDVPKARIIKVTPTPHVGGVTISYMSLDAPFPIRMSSWVPGNRKLLCAKRPVKAADIDDLDMLNVIDWVSIMSAEVHGFVPNQFKGGWAMTWDIFPLVDFPPKVVRAKLDRLLSRGWITGCNCGCRGDFELLEEGYKVLTSIPSTAEEIRDSPLLLDRIPT